ncbi:MAG: hypothetical protein ACFE9D_01700 [Promethearchaeota archaeon]
MVFCPTVHGPCIGRAKCRLWIRGRILYTDSKLLAAQLARFTLEQDNTNTPQPITPKIRDTFWQNQGIPNIQREIIVDRYLREKVIEVERLAEKWVQSPGFHKTILATYLNKPKESSAPHKQHCKSPP